MKPEDASSDTRLTPQQPGTAGPDCALRTGSGPVWDVDWDADENTMWEAASPYCIEEDGPPLMWRLKQRLRNNSIEWYEASDLELIEDEDSPRAWPTLADAQSAILFDHLQIIAEVSDPNAELSDGEENQ